MMQIDKAQFIRTSTQIWLNHLSHEAQVSARSIFKNFETEMDPLNAFELLFQARKSQGDTAAIESALSQYYSRCVNRGLSPASSKQYVLCMRGFFKANRIRLPRLQGQLVPMVSLGVLALEQTA